MVPPKVDKYTRETKSQMERRPSSPVGTHMAQAGQRQMMAETIQEGIPLHCVRRGLDKILRQQFDHGVRSVGFLLSERLQLWFQVSSINAENKDVPNYQQLYIHQNVSSLSQTV